VCHREDRVLEASEALIKTADRDKKFAKRVAESARRVLAFKKKNGKTLRLSKPPSATMVEKLTRNLWEFGEQVRLGPLSRREDRRRRA
jgi:hypothetical protein